MPDRLWEDYVRTGDLDFSHELTGVARYRVNLFRQQRGAGAVFRIIPSKIMSVGQLGLPDAVRRAKPAADAFMRLKGEDGQSMA